MHNVLPEQFKVAHDLCFVLHDFLAEYILKGEEAGLLYFKVDLRRPEDAEAIQKVQ